MAGAILQWIKKRKVTVLLLIFTFIMSGLIINLLQLFTIPLYWHKRKWFRQINARLVYLHWCILPWALDSWANYDIRIFSSDNNLKEHINTEHALVLLNHRGDLDWMIGWVLIERIGMLGGTKAIMKDIAKYLPGIGWTFVFMEYPFLKRDWVKDEKRLKASCKSLADYPVNMLLCLFAEGTRFTEEKHKLSMEFSKSRGLPILKHHLFPRTKGFCFLLNNMKDTFGAIYDVTTCYRGKKEPSIMGAVNAESCGADIFIRRIDISKVPTESDEVMSNWLIDLYKSKDDMIEYHNQHKTFDGLKFDVAKRPWADIVVLMWMLVLGFPVLLSMVYLAWVGKWFVLGLIVMAVILADQLFQYIANETVTANTSSSYGLKPVANNGVHLNSVTNSSNHTATITSASNPDTSKKDK